MKQEIAFWIRLWPTDKGVPTIYIEQYAPSSKDENTFGPYVVEFDLPATVMCRVEELTPQRIDGETRTAERISGQARHAD